MRAITAKSLVKACQRVLKRDSAVTAYALGLIVEGFSAYCASALEINISMLSASGTAENWTGFTRIFESDISFAGESAINGVDDRVIRIRFGAAASANKLECRLICIGANALLDKIGTTF